MKGTPNNSDAMTPIADEVRQRVSLFFVPLKYPEIYFKVLLNLWCEIAGQSANMVGFILCLFLLHSTDRTQPHQK
jgi:hypothetical protein